MNQRSVTKRMLRTMALLFAMTPFWAGSAQAFEFEVQVKIVELIAQVSFDQLSETDFYAQVTIDGQTQDNWGKPGQLALEDNDAIEPNIFVVGGSDWILSEFVDGTKGTVPITIRIFDDDDDTPGTGGDQQADVENGPGTNIDITLDMTTCSFSGELSGDCDMTVTTMGDGEADGNAILKFQVSIVGLDDTAGLHIYCLHDPIWPQPGDTVKITAVALGDTLNPKIVDEIQISTATSTPDVQAMGAAITSFTTPPVNAPEFTYTCTALDDANNDSTIDSGDPNEVATTGFKTVAVGIPSGSDGVPFLSSGSEMSRQDIVLIPDSSYSGAAMNAAFLEDVANLVGLYFRSGITFIDNQDKVNFWIAQTSGSVGGGFNAGNCPRTPPSNWSMDYTFANAAAILHRKDIRDCANMGIATAQTIGFDENGNGIPFEPVVGFSPFVHELGHAVFSLADEYCNTRPGGNPMGSCDGGYFQIMSLPNVFAGQSACDQDKAGDPNAPATAVCQCFTSQNVKTLGQAFCTYDPPSGDLMVNNKLPKYLDNRRINSVFTNCTGC